MSLPFSKFVSIATGVIKPAFTIEKKHLILGVACDKIPAINSIFEVTSGDVLKLSQLFGENSKEVSALKKYFSFMGKTGDTTDKAIIARWFNVAQPATIFGDGKLATIEKIKTIASKFVLKINGTSGTFEVNFKTVKTYSDVASIMKGAINKFESGGADFIKANVRFISAFDCFVIESGVPGKGSTIEIMPVSGAGDVASKQLLIDLGFSKTINSSGVDTESYADFVRRIYAANTAGFAITTRENVDEADIINAVKFLGEVDEGQTINTRIKLIFNFTDIEKVKECAAVLSKTGCTGYVLTYDPFDEGVNILDAAIGGAVDFMSSNSAINFNFQKASGFTPITNFNHVHDFQNGITDASFTAELDKLKISYVYSVGIGTQESVMYGLGLMAGDFGSEDIQIGESYLEAKLQNAVMNALNSLPKIPLQGRDAKELIGLLLIPSFKSAVSASVIASGGKLSDSDKLTLTQSLGSDAVSSVESNGYYFTVINPTDDDIKNRRLTVKYAYLASGVVNKLRITGSIFGA